MFPPLTAPRSSARQASQPTWWPGSAPSSPIANAALFFRAPQIFSPLFLLGPLRDLLSPLCCLLFMFLPYICQSRKGLCFLMLMILLLLLVRFLIAGTLR